MKERPILFSGAMVRAILEGRKTQTRRVVKPQFTRLWGSGVRIGDDSYSAHVDIRTNDGWKWLRCPYGKPGDRLWVRETWSKETVDGSERIAYRADIANGYNFVGWKPSIYMPRWASRITLEITDVKVERLQEISETDAEAEGIQRIESRIPGITHGLEGLAWTSARKGFQALWDDINLESNTPILQQTKSWEANPWVWAITFKVQP